MKKSNLLKLIVVIGLSLVLAFSLVSVVKADDTSEFSGWTEADPVNTANTTNTTSVDNTTNTVNTANTTNTVETTNITTDTANEFNYSTITTENTTTTINTTSNEEENEVNNLAYTGIEDNSMLVVVILVGAIVAGYSLKKVREYNI